MSSESYGKRIGIRDLARLAQVSLGTVDRALHGRSEVSEKTREHVLRLARKHGYTPNPTARALSVGRVNVRVGVCLPPLDHSFYKLLQQGIAEEAKQPESLGLQILYRPLKKLHSKVTKAVQTLLEAGVQALILTPPSSSQAASAIEEAERGRNVRVICVAADDSHSCRSGSILMDPALNGMLAAELLAKFVSARAAVALVADSQRLEDNALMIEAFRQTFEKDCPGGRLVTVANLIDGGKKTYQKCRELLQAYPQLSGLYVGVVDCVPVCEAIHAEGRAGRLKVITTDLLAKAVPYFIDGTLAASIYRDPFRQGQLAVRALADHFYRGVGIPPFYRLTPSVVLRSNLTLFREARALQ